MMQIKDGAQTATRTLDPEWLWYEQFFFSIYFLFSPWFIALFLHFRQEWWIVVLGDLCHNFVVLTIRPCQDNTCISLPPRHIIINITAWNRSTHFDLKLQTVKYTFQQKNCVISLLLSCKKKDWLAPAVKPSFGMRLTIKIIILWRQQNKIP